MAAVGSGCSTEGIVGVMIYKIKGVFGILRGWKGNGGRMTVGTGVAEELGRLVMGDLFLRYNRTFSAVCMNMYLYYPFPVVFLFASP
jgi:hypothetical protein